MSWPYWEYGTIPLATIEGPTLGLLQLPLGYAQTHEVCDGRFNRQLSGQDSSKLDVWVCEGQGMDESVWGWVVD